MKKVLILLLTAMLLTFVCAFVGCDGKIDISSGSETSESVSADPHENMLPQRVIAFFEPSSPIYTSYQMQNLLNYGNLTVTAIYEDGTTEDVKEGYKILNTGRFVAGSNTFSLYYKGQLSEFPVFAEAVQVVDLAATYEQEEYIFTDDALSSIENAGELVVTATYNDGTSERVYDYTLSGTFRNKKDMMYTENTISVAYEGKRTNITVLVYAVNEIRDYDPEAVLSYTTAQFGSDYTALITTTEGYFTTYVCDWFSVNDANLDGMIAVNGNMYYYYCEYDSSYTTYGYPVTYTEWALGTSDDFYEAFYLPLTFAYEYFEFEGLGDEDELYYYTSYDVPILHSYYMSMLQGKAMIFPTCMELVVDPVNLQIVLEYIYDENLELCGMIEYIDYQENAAKFNYDGIFLDDEQYNFSSASASQDAVAADFKRNPFLSDVSYTD